MSDDLPDPVAPSRVTLPPSRARAIEAGAVRFFSGEPCPAGHVAARYTLSSYCVQCQRERARAEKARIHALRSEGGR